MWDSWTTSRFTPGFSRQTKWLSFSTIPAVTIPVSFGNGFGTALGATILIWSTAVTRSGSWKHQYFLHQRRRRRRAAVSRTANLPSCKPASRVRASSASIGKPRRSRCDDFDLEFDIDGIYQGDISGQTSWRQFTLEIDDSSTHTLTWNANTLQDYGSSPTDAGFVDQVVFTPDVAPVITLNPFDQTNYPGYTVALLAGATGNPAPTWQWYEVGNPNPIPGATSALFIPANSGTSNVAGSYYAVAGNLAGSQTTTTALVTFVSAPLPPDWSEAFKSPFVNYDTTALHGE